LVTGHGLLHAAAPQQKAWNILKNGAAEKSVLKRANATRALGLLPHNAQATAMAEKGLSDDNSDVRAAAAVALGEMHAVGSIPKLTAALSDKDPTVVLSAAHSLLLMRDHKAYDVYYAILTGGRKGGRGLIAEQREMLDDPKKLATFGVETGLGFVPFGGLGVSAYKIVSKNTSDSVRAAAAQVLAKDPDPSRAPPSSKPWWTAVMLYVSRPCALWPCATTRGSSPESNRTWMMRKKPCNTPPPLPWSG
jgi:HEAT repeat protein